MVDNFLQNYPHNHKSKFTNLHKIYDIPLESANEDNNKPNDPNDPDNENKDFFKKITVEVIKQSLEHFDLDHHEDGDHNGHTKLKHIERDEAWLKQRLIDEPWIDAASSYPDKETAERVIKEIMSNKAHEIADWANEVDVGKQKPFASSFNNNIGQGVKPGISTTIPMNKALVVIRKTKDGLKIITSYPVE